MSKKDEPASMSGISIIPSSEAYVEQMETITGLIYDLNPREDDQVFNAEFYRQHISIFPEGQFIALDTDTNQVVGLTVSMRTHHNPSFRHHESWWGTIGDGWLTTHAPNGEWMYGVESCVLPAYRGCGVGSKLMDARFNLLKRLNLRGMIAGSAIIDYGNVAHQMTPEQYVDEVVAGKRFDTNLTKQLHKGFKVQYLIPGYLDLDFDCRGYGVLIQWDNPDYQPAKMVRPVAASRPAFQPSAAFR